jgi:hypothetical protein
MTELRVKHADVIQNPRYSFIVIRALEGTETVRVTCFGGDEVSAHVEQHSAILLDHPEEADIACFTCKLCGLEVKLFALGKIAATLRNDCQAIEAVRLAGDRAALFGVNKALGITAIRGLGFALLTVKCALPPECVGEKREIVLAVEYFDRIVVKSERSCGVTTPFGVAGSIDERTRASRLSLRHDETRLTFMLRYLMATHVIGLQSDRELIVHLDPRARNQYVAREVVDDP